MENKLWLFGAFVAGAMGGYMYKKSQLDKGTSNFVGEEPGVPMSMNTVNAAGAQPKQSMEQYLLKNSFPGGSTNHL